jgi:hypothetical protein
VALDMPNPFSRPDRAARLCVVLASTTPSNLFQQKFIRQCLARGLPSSRYSLSCAIVVPREVRSLSFRW